MAKSKSSLPPLSELIKKGARGDEAALARALSELERLGAQALHQAPELLEPSHPALRLGLTGPPGAGKSTLVSQLIRHLRQQELKVGVIAVDPSSPISQGAILGDRIRYSEHFLDSQVFIRSLGTRGSLGGLSASAYLMLRAFDLCAFDVVLVETVGVGQSEMDIMHVADEVMVVLVPESGDAVQAMKAGLLEIADVFVVNKADRPGASSLARELELSAQMSAESGRKSAEVVQTVATEGRGVDILVNRALASFNSPEGWKARRSSAERLRHEAKALLRQHWEHWVQKQTEGLKNTNDLLQLIASMSSNAKDGID